MSKDEEMTIDERYKYLRLMQKRYGQMKRQERGKLLDEMAAMTGLHRKSLIRLLNGELERRVRRRQRGRRYGAAMEDALRVISESSDYICAERLTPNLVWLAEHLASHGELRLTAGLREQLGSISVSTVRRILRRLQQDQRRLAVRRQPRQLTGLLAEVPMGQIPWNIQEPGHWEGDTVFHGGASAAGEFLCTVQLVDVLTLWSERVAVLGRSYLVMADAFQRILLRLPFPIVEIHTDNGSEFLNHHLLRFWRSRQPPVHPSRSRPYHKNDNRFVEGRNSTLVRAYLGYERLDTVAHVWAVNQLYDLLWLYNNFFQPVMRLRHKEIIPVAGQPPRVKRHFDRARTPFERLCETEALWPAHRTLLELLRDKTNPRQLRQQIYDQIDTIFSLPLATPGQTENVYHTLLSYDGPEAYHSPWLQLAFNRTPRRQEGGELTLSS